MICDKYIASRTWVGQRVRIGILLRQHVIAPSAAVGVRKCAVARQEREVPSFAFQKKPGLKMGPDS